MGVKKPKPCTDTELLSSQQMYFDRCVDFLATMMEKYGAEIQLPMPEDVNPKADDAGENVA